MVSYSTVESSQQIRKLKERYKKEKIPWEDTLAAAYVEATSAKSVMQTADASSLIYQVEQILKRELAACIANRIQTQADKPAKNGWGRTWRAIWKPLAAFFMPENKDKDSQ